MKKVLLLFLVFFVALGLNAATISSKGPGSWNDPATWSCGCIPGAGDDVTVEHLISSAGDVTVNTLKFSTEWGPVSGNGQLTVASGVFTVSGGAVSFGNNGQDTHSLTVAEGATFTTPGDITWLQGANITVDGTLNAHDFTVANGESGDFTVGPTGVVNFSGTVSMKKGGPHAFNIEGEMTIGEDLIVSGDNSVDVEGSLVVMDEIIIRRGGSVGGIGNISAGSCTSTGDNPCPNITPLPVTLLYFTATGQSNTVAINWASSKAWDFSHYELERSANGSDFSKIADIAASENSELSETYAYTDHQPLSGTSYYRLKAVDIDGSFEYKGIELVKFGAESFKVYPNPSAIGEIFIDCSHAGEQLNVVLKDNSGRTVRSAMLEGTENSLSTAGLSAGLYLLKVDTPAGTQQAQVMIR